ncbi:MAG: HD-GYP domain-containing protein [Betaproteobacteria bacterium]
MLKRIGVEQLQVGMYLEEFCCSWMEHPFWRSGFVITDSRDIERIRSSSVSECWIDCRRGTDVAPDQASVSVTEAETRIETELNQANLEPRLAENTCAIDEYARAAEICADAKQRVIAIFQDARMGKAIDTVGAQGLVEQIIESVTRNSCALTSLARLKSSSEFTYMHCVAVCALMVALAQRLGLDHENTRAAGLAGLLHDLGKAALPIELLHKPEKLSEDEFDIIRRHPFEGTRLLQNCGVGGAVLDVCLNHHARMDGSGYPNKVKGNEISLLAKMAAVCDVYDAISSGRPYKDAWDPAEAMRKMAEWTSGHFDPVVFHAFVKSIGIYPVGSLVRLTSGRLAVVVEQATTSLLTPSVKVFFSTQFNARILEETVDLSSTPGEFIEAREDPAKWNFPDLFTLWSGLSHSPW